ncbi:unnamed protein product [Candida verbasci]|uniref:Uncharacterized protein n=1 Tax=Candida verbasci TaxID=1227364 RepID=A0A9W4XBF3_9ASCO|nr:unnamed protein product [Candida verbasci]
MLFINWLLIGAASANLSGRDDHDGDLVVTDCHFHGEQQYCIDWDGVEGEIQPVPSDAPDSYGGCHSHGNDTYCLYNNEEIQFIREVETHEDHEGEEEHVHEDDHDHEEEGHEHAEEGEVTDCHFHDEQQYCIDWNGEEGEIIPVLANAPNSYSGCHSHGNETFCTFNGEEVQFLRSGDATEVTTNDEGLDCHFHAGVEHCTGAGVENNERVCERVDRDYDIPLRIGFLFVILVTSSIGTFGPMIIKSLLKLSPHNFIIIILKQFGTGVIISTAFVHLITHANLMWSNSCLTIHYEATSQAITMAGIFLAFILEYIAHRLVDMRKPKQEAARSKLDEVEGETSDVSSDFSKHANSTNDKVSVMLLEAGIVFHSILIGITLAVTGDTYFITLFIVIVFHQFFEGLALGSRIIELDQCKLLTKLIMALVFALITPIGMAIGIGTLNKFNGNDPSTLIALGTLDSLSAGVLLWTGLVEMLSSDWLHGSLRTANWIKTSIAMIALIAGLILMSVLGKWA